MELLRGALPLLALAWLGCGGSTPGAQGKADASSNDGGELVMRGVPFDGSARCQAFGYSCSCATAAPPGADAAAPCNAQAYPSGFCCASDSWPSSGQCGCAAWTCDNGDPTRCACGEGIGSLASCAGQLCCADPIALTCVCDNQGKSACPPMETAVSSCSPANFTCGSTFHSVTDCLR